MEDIIFLVKKDWHEGLIGIVASRLKEHYNRPAVHTFSKWIDLQRIC